MPPYIAHTLSFKALSSNGKIIKFLPVQTGSHRLNTSSMSTVELAVNKNTNGSTKVTLNNSLHVNESISQV